MSPRHRPTERLATLRSFLQPAERAKEIPRAFVRPKTNVVPTFEIPRALTRPKPNWSNNQTIGCSSPVAEAFANPRPRIPLASHTLSTRCACERTFGVGAVVDSKQSPGQSPTANLRCLSGWWWSWDRSRIQELSSLLSKRWWWW